MRPPTSSPPEPRSVAAPRIVYPWNPDQGDGTFRNPVLFADYSDPDAVRVGDDFYLVSSSFNCTPGLPILHSRDLVNWTLVNHAIRNVPHPRFEAVQHGCGVWAPAIRFHAGKFWIFFPMPDEGIYVTTAAAPAGKWSEPHLLQAGKGLIDPCPLWDEDGQAYLVHAYSHSRAGIRDRLHVRPMAPDGSRFLDEGKIVFHDPERHPTLEGPKFLKRNGWYYLLAPAGGVPTGWQAVLRSRHIYGPYEDKIVLEQGSTPINGPHQGALVDTPGGQWWFLHFQCADTYGRVVHLQPVHWQDDWPLMGEDLDGNGIGEPVMSSPKPETNGHSGLAVPATSDEFDSARLGLQWQWQANHHDNWCEPQPGRSRLRLPAKLAPQANLADIPNLLLQKFPARLFVVETLLEFSPRQDGEEAGLVIWGEASAALCLRHTGTSNQLLFRADGSEKPLLETSAKQVRLRVQVKEGGVCEFSFATDGPFVTVPETFQARKGKWVGAKVGIYSLTKNANQPSGHTDFDYFRFSAPASP